MRRVAGETLPLRVMSDPKVTAVPVKQEAAKEEKVEEPLRLPVQEREPATAKEETPQAEKAATEKATPSPAVERPRRTAAEKTGNAGPITMENYEARYLHHRTKRETPDDINYRIDKTIVQRLRRINNSLFDGKVSMCVLINNILLDHLDFHDDFFDTIHKQKFSNNWKS